MLSWLGPYLLQITLCCSERRSFPCFFSKENSKGAPVNSLLVTNSCVQVFLVSFLFTQSTYRFGFALASSDILIPYGFTALFQLKSSSKESVGTPGGRTRNIIIGLLTSVYSAYLIYAGGFAYFLLTMIAYRLGLILYDKMLKDTGKTIFQGKEVIATVIVLILCIICIYQMITGQISLADILAG